MLDLSVAERYCAGGSVSTWSSHQHVIVAALSEDEEGDFDWDGGVVLGSILPVRAARNQCKRNRVVRRC